MTETTEGWRLVGYLCLGAAAIALTSAFPYRGLPKIPGKSETFKAVGWVSFAAALVASVLALGALQARYRVDEVKFALAALAAVVFAGLFRALASEAGQRRLMRILKLEEAHLEDVDRWFLGATPVLVVLVGGFLLVFAMVLGSQWTR
ncbi:MAG: hypothetical protein VKS61_05220 [Candidatus Sericytochromatia bacterium]|nr:hypothetical protein [Candidatus Sericytochromatia bacterium]